MYQLRADLRQMGLPVDGTREELFARLIDADKQLITPPMGTTVSFKQLPQDLAGEKTAGVVSVLEADAGHPTAGTPQLMQGTPQPAPQLIATAKGGGATATHKRCVCGCKDSKVGPKNARHG
eukprot:SAG31_NODE_11652_length_1010_cov_1.125137_1_plen_122_part_00